MLSLHDSSCTFILLMLFLWVTLGPWEGSFAHPKFSVDTPCISVQITQCLCCLPLQSAVGPKDKSLRIFIHFLLQRSLPIRSCLPNCHKGFLWASRKTNQRQEIKLFKVISGQIWILSAFIWSVWGYPSECFQPTPYLPPSFSFIKPFVTRS